MLEMVQNLLDTNAIERGQLKPKVSPCDLTDLVQTVVESFRSHAEAKQQMIKLTTNGDRIVALADPTLTVQVLENLISNAVKYSPVERTIQVGLTATEDSVRCEVRDEGPGLSKEDQQRLFEKFARLSARPTGGEPSVGLGLSIVKKMVESMGGQVFCESELGKGATFIVELPSTKDRTNPAQ
jgi:signal transduction histidine kinase